MVSVYRGATCEAEPSGAVEPQAETNTAIVAATSGRTIPPERAQRELGSAMGTRQAEQALEEAVALRPSCVESRNPAGESGTHGSGDGGGWRRSRPARAARMHRVHEIEEAYPLLLRPRAGAGTHADTRLRSRRGAFRREG